MSKRSKLMDIARLGSAFLQTRLLSKPMPLFVGWNITFRCNLHCQYCGARDTNEELHGGELNTEDVFQGFKRFLAFGHSLDHV